MSDMAPCPFCGSAAERIDIPAEDGEPNAGGSLIGCMRCGASSAVHFDRKENLLSGWNERVGDIAWQPIAPRPDTNARPWDGEDYLVYGPHGHGVQVVFWDDEKAASGYPWGTLDGPFYPTAAFTHYQPLPKPPVQP